MKWADNSYPDAVQYYVHKVYVPVEVVHVQRFLYKKELKSESKVVPGACVEMPP